ncbi:hypothetical protein, partial [Acinetobacter variabilis]|uniref:hypothetical protein n=1 Tax=Acinetobacter variabilis TaxID=70346 RepID=UPI003AF65537
DGSVVTINKDNNHWYIDGVDTGVVAVAQNGKDGTVVTIGTNGNWFIDGVDTNVAAAGKDGKSALELAKEAGVIGDNGTVQDLFTALKGEKG